MPSSVPRPAAPRRRPPRLVATLVVLGSILIGVPLGAQAGFDPDVLPRGRWTVGIDTQVHQASPAEASWVWVLPGGSVGLGGGLEAGLRVSLFEPRAGPPTHDLVPQLRWRAWADSVRGLRAGFGVIGVVPFGGIAERQPGAYLTATGAWTAASTGTSVTLGVWHGMQAAALGEARHGAIIEAAQVLARDGRTQLAASWFSGRTLFGYLTVGVARDIGAHTLFVGWAHGNAPRFNTGPTVTWSWTP